VINQVKAGLPQNNRWFACPAGVTAGMACLIGGKDNRVAMAAVAIDAYDPSTSGTTFALDGSYTLTVAGNSQASPATALELYPGDPVYATGTYDATTGVTYSLTLDATIGNHHFGYLDQGSVIAAGVTNTAAVVRLKG
jgi:hypothetical protein